MNWKTTAITLILIIFLGSLLNWEVSKNQKLTNAKAEIDKLRDDVRNGSKRVYANAKCPKPESSSTSGVDASSPPP